MGGGDLNMKKHFHPLTRENLERVWKAEKKRDDELKRIEERKKEIAEERAKAELMAHASESGIIQRKEERLEWMYAGCRVSAEEFLLGKEVTDEFIENAAIERKAKNSSRQTGVDGSLQTIDLARKIREDPLFQIKKREAAAAKELIQNSARFKQIINSSRRDVAQSTLSGRRDTHTPRTSQLASYGWDTPSIRRGRSPSNAPGGGVNKSSSHYSSSRHESRRSQMSHKESRRRSKSRSRSDSCDVEERLHKMRENARWRETTRKRQIEDESNHDELNKKIEEQLQKFMMKKSAFAQADGVKMGNWSSQRYVKR